MDLKKQNRPTIAILMATYNGERFLHDQIDSFIHQSSSNWQLIASDDGSADATVKILEDYQATLGADKIQIRRGPSKGFCKNFLSMACDASIRADYYAFSDQDDVWYPEKLQVAIDYLATQDPAIPAVYCGRTTYVDEQLKFVGYSPIFIYPRRFRNALVQSIAGGNTMVFNPAAKALLEAAGSLNVISHDWWLYILVMAAGGKVYYDPTPYVYYRQHPAALIGGNTSLSAKLKRLTMAINGRFRSWNDTNLSALQQCRHLMTENSTEILDLFLRLRNSHLIHRYRMIEVCGLYRQTRSGTISLIVAAALKKI
jgi:glycosyltransferase involved in cell wall biosynthesis